VFPGRHSEESVTAAMQLASQKWSAMQVLGEEMGVRAGKIDDTLENSITRVLSTMNAAYIEDRHLSRFAFHQG
jgi:hypothetical protein